MEGARANLRYFSSSLVVLALSDATFVAGVKKAAPNQKAAENLLKDLIKDVSRVQNIEGSKSLLGRMKSIAESDAKVLVSVSSQLKSAADTIRKTGQTKAQARRDAHHLTPKENYEVVQSAESALALRQLAIAAAQRIVGNFTDKALINLYENLFTTGGIDRLAACHDEADQRLSTCNRAADQLSFPYNLAAKGLCYAQWAIDIEQCLIR